jgi:hypothetical protein
MAPGQPRRRHLDAFKQAQFRFHRDSVRMRAFHHAPRYRHILLEGKYDASIMTEL